MKKYEVVSVDMFGTLADLSSVRENMWREILGKEYTPNLAEEYWNRASNLLYEFFETKIMKEGQYVPPKSMFFHCFSILFAEKGISANPEEATTIFTRHHSRSGLFNDAQLFLISVGREYPVCLSSDTDEDMLGPLRDIYPFDKVFTSEEIGAYKTGSDGRFFKALVAHYGIKPEFIIHVGDTIADIAGASQAGITTCWLNRTGRTWPYEVKPDVELSSLLEFAEILNVDVNLDTIGQEQDR